jgi:exodeoxyribonuclease V alpha subunit
VAWRDDYTGETKANIVPENFSERKRRTESIYRISGHFAHPLVAGEVVELKGLWQKDRKGEQVFAADKIVRKPPTSREGEIVLLASIIKQMSKKQAAELIEHYGSLDALIDACENRPETLEAALPKARKLQARLRNTRWDRNEIDIDLYVALHSAGKDEDLKGGIRTDQIQRLVRHFGAGPLKKILQTSPYDVMAVDKIGFGTADKVAFYYAAKQGRTFDPLDPERLKYGVVEILSRERSNGHVCAPETHLLDRVMSSLRSPDGQALPRGDRARKAVQEAVSKALEAKLLLPEDDMLYVRGMWNTEDEVALKISKMLLAGSGDDPAEKRRILRFLDDHQKKIGMKLNEQQRDAILVAMLSPISIIRGGPGCGKTLTASCLVATMKHFSRTFMIVAPTGKAAKRAADVIGEEANTIHRACGLDLEEDLLERGRKHKPTARDRFRVEYLIVDESSMVDLTLFNQVLARLTPGRTKLVLIGDGDQLPPVGAGQPFRDLIASGVVNEQVLTEVYRQAGGSPIIDGAYEINSGKSPSVSGDSYEVRLLDPVSSKEYLPSGDAESDGRMEANIIAKWLLYSVDKYASDLGIDPIRDIQVYAPQRVGPSGINELNSMLRDHFNPLPAGIDLSRMGAIRIAEKYVVQVGDKVMQIANNYRMRFCASAPPEAITEFSARLEERLKEERKKNRRKRNKPGGAPAVTGDVVPVMNGQVGYVTRVDMESRELEVKFDDLSYPVLYRNAGEWGKLAPAWAMSVHRSQGSETPYAFIVLHSSVHMINRPLLYTAWTRAKKGVLLLATKDVIRRAASNMRGVDRFSKLPQRLKGHVRGKERRRRALAL